MKPFTHPRPKMPAHLRHTDRLLTRSERQLDIVQAGGHVDPKEIIAGLEAILIHVARPRTPQELAEEARYEREVKAYNKAAREYNERARAARQAKINAREVAKVRAAACPRCTITHAGEC